MALQTFSPREIQARVRGGESAEVVAAETGWPAGQGPPVRRAPAGRARLHRRAGPVRRDPPFRWRCHPARVGARGARRCRQRRGPDALDWDAWRREDGKWIVTATYRDRDGAHTARWTYDHVGRNLHPLDDEARTLMGARPVPSPTSTSTSPTPSTSSPTSPSSARRRWRSRPRLVAVPDADDDRRGRRRRAVDDRAVRRAGGAHPRHETVSIAHPSATEEPGPPPRRPSARPAARKPKAPQGPGQRARAGTRSSSGPPQSPTTSHGPNGSGCADMCSRWDRAAVVCDR